MKTFITLTTIPTEISFSYSWFIDPDFISGFIMKEGMIWKQAKDSPLWKLGGWHPALITFVGLGASDSSGQELGRLVIETPKEILEKIKQLG